MADRRSVPCALKRIRVMGEEGYREFQVTRGARSLDGLPAQQD